MLKFVILILVNALTSRERKNKATSHQRQAYHISNITNSCNFLNSVTQQKPGNIALVLDFLQLLISRNKEGKVPSELNTCDLSYDNKVHHDIMSILASYNRKIFIASYLSKI